MANNYGLWTVRPQDTYLKEMAAEQERAQMAALESAYKQNVSGLDTQKSNIAPAFATAKNQTAAQNEIAGRSFGEYAAATGLNSGAAGQAQLARSNALQSGLSALNQQETKAYGDIEAQRQSMQEKYTAAINEAKATNNANLAQSLYQEAIRVDNSLADISYKTAALTQNDADTKYKKDLYNAELMAQYGDFSGYRALGYTDEQIASMTAKYGEDRAYEEAARNAKLYGPGGDPEPERSPELDSLYEDMRKSGMPEAFLAANYKNYGIAYSQIANVLSGYDDWYSKRVPNPMSTDNKDDNYRTIGAQAEAFLTAGAPPEMITALLAQAVDKFMIDQDQAVAMMKNLGIA